MLPVLGSSTLPTGVLQVAGLVGCDFAALLLYEGDLHDRMDFNAILGKPMLTMLEVKEGRAGDLDEPRRCQRLHLVSWRAQSGRHFVPVLADLA